MKVQISLGVGGALASSLSLLFATSAEAQQQSALSAAMLEEVVVTARRREENLMELPLSVQSIGAEAMQAQGIYNVQQITEYVPNVALVEVQRTNDTRIFIRGIGGGWSNPSQIFGTRMYIDGHVITGTLGNFYSTSDVERVEVLRGPQGTLFGANTTGGLVNIVTAKPAPEFDSSVTLRAADFGEQSVRAMLNVPFSENVFARFNYSNEQNDGFYFNEFLGTDEGGKDEQTLSAALRFTPGNWTIDARYWLGEDRDDNRGGSCQTYASEAFLQAINNAGFAYTGDGPGPLGSYPDGFAQFGPPPLGFPAIFLGASTPFDYLTSCDSMRASGDYVTRSNLDTLSYVDNESFNVDATWDSGGAVGPLENAQVQIKVGTRDNQYRYQQDLDWTDIEIMQFGTVPNRSGGKGVQRLTDEFEVILTADVSDRLQFTTGFYWMEDTATLGRDNCLNAWQAAYDPNGDNGDPGDDGEFGTNDDPIGTINGMLDDTIECPLEGGYIFEFPFQQNYATGRTIGESTAIYAHFDYAINDTWEVGFGARAMEDKRSQENWEIGSGGGGVIGCGGQNAPLTELCDPGVVFLNRTSLLDEGIYTDVEETFSETTPMISLTRTLTPGDTLDSGIIYFLISQGWLTGAFNDELNANLVEPFRSAVRALIPYGPESVTNYEFGFKGQMFDGRLSLAATAFLMDYNDKQEVIEVDNSDGRFGPGGNIEYTDNVASAEISGIELELRSSPWDGGYLALDVGWLDKEYTDYSVFNLGTLEFDDLSNLAIQAYTPDWTITGTVEHVFELANGGTITPQLGVYLQDDYEFFPLPVGQESSFCHQDSYAKWRTRITYAPPAGNWQASLFGYNITDERILEDCGGGRGGTFMFAYGAPDQWGAEFTMRFGSGGN